MCKPNCSTLICVNLIIAHCSESFDKVPLTGERSYYNKQERDWWQQANLSERLDDDYSEIESTFMERQTPGGVKYTSAPGQYPPPSVRRTRRDDLDWDSSSDERDRAYMQNVHIRDSDIRVGYAFPREPGLFHSGVLASGGG